LLNQTAQNPCISGAFPRSTPRAFDTLDVGGDNARASFLFFFFAPPRNFGHFAA
jgi:hypothetical protein